MVRVVYPFGSTSPIKVLLRLCDVVSVVIHGDYETMLEAEYVAHQKTSVVRNHQRVVDEVTNDLRRRVRTRQSPVREDWFIAHVDFENSCRSLHNKVAVDVQHASGGATLRCTYKMRSAYVIDATSFEFEESYDSDSENNSDDGDDDSSSDDDGDDGDGHFGIQSYI